MIDFGAFLVYMNFSFCSRRPQVSFVCTSVWNGYWILCSLITLNCKQFKIRTWVFFELNCKLNDVYFRLTGQSTGLCTVRFVLLTLHWKRHTYRVASRFTSFQSWFFSSGPWVQWLVEHNLSSIRLVISCWFWILDEHAIFSLGFIPSSLVLGVVI